MTLKKAFFRGVMGIPVGVFINTTILLIISIIHGTISPITDPELTPIGLFKIQYMVSCIIGFVFGAGSAVFEHDKWSIGKQTVVHFFITSLTFIPCAVAARWVDNNLYAIMDYILVFVFIYVFIWAVQYFTLKKRIAKMNKRLEKL